MTSALRVGDRVEFTWRSLRGTPRRHEGIIWLLSCEDRPDRLEVLTWEGACVVDPAEVTVLPAWRPHPVRARLAHAVLWLAWALYQPLKWVTSRVRPWLEQEQWYEARGHD